jgi:hypothetical protein
MTHAPSYSTVPRRVCCDFDQLRDRDLHIPAAVFRIRTVAELSLAVARHAQPHYPDAYLYVDLSALPVGTLHGRDPEGVLPDAAAGTFTVRGLPPDDLHDGHAAAGVGLFGDRRAVLLADSGMGGRHPVMWAAARIAVEERRTVTVVDELAAHPHWDGLLERYGPGLAVRHVTLNRLARHPDDARDPATVYVVVADRLTNPATKAWAALRPVLADPGQPALVYLHPRQWERAQHVSEAVYGDAGGAPYILFKAAALSAERGGVPLVNERPFGHHS